MKPTALNHPLETLRDGGIGFVSGESRPLPLRAMAFEIAVRNGLATVTTKRSFCNEEAVPIEAVLTFPVPFDAVLTRLAARIDGRDLSASAKARNEARETYEDALDRGKLAILHEEALRGLHVLSVGQLGPGKEIELIAEMIMPVAVIGEAPSLRIPTTVGQIYGTSPLLPADDLATGANALPTATLRVMADTHAVTVNALPIDSEAIEVPLDRAIQIALPGAPFGTVEGFDAEGRRVYIKLEPIERKTASAHVTVLFDRSGSTSERLGKMTVWAAMRAGLEAALQSLNDKDHVELWDFGSDCRKLGVAEGSRSVNLLDQIGAPEGGTELGSAVRRAIEAGAQDILLITDGKTWSSEVQETAALGRRITSVLVGADSIDAMIGHLSAMTGGQVFAAAGSDVAPALSAAFDSLRTPSSPQTGVLDGSVPITTSVVRSGVRLTVDWDREASRGMVDAPGRFAAALILPLLPEREATRYSLLHGLCTHLTSLVLVDEAGEATQGISEMRRVPLLERLASFGMSRAGENAHYSAPPSMCMSIDADYFAHPAPIARPRFDGNRYDARNLASKIPWTQLANALAAGDLTGLASDLADELKRIAEEPEIRALADALAMDPLVIAVGLIAAFARGWTANRLTRKILSKAPAILVRHARHRLSA